MDKTDARTLTPETQEHLRRQAIRLKKQGRTYVATAVIVGVHRNAVSRWWKTYERAGLKGPKARLEGLLPATGGPWTRPGNKPCKA